MEDYAKIILTVSSRLELDNPTELNLVNAARGYPNGWPLNMSCEEIEKLSPGITDAQQNARFAIRHSFDGRIRFNPEGNASYEIVVPEGMDVRLVGE